MKRLGAMFTILTLGLPSAFAGPMPSVRKQIWAEARREGALKWLMKPTLRLSSKGNVVTARVYALKGGGPRIVPPLLFRQPVLEARFSLRKGLDGSHAVKQLPWKNIYIPRP